MSFPSKVSEQALLDCGRHCCICHKFCGFKIELHHIIQRADGGEDNYENCIPLCLDCHAEVKAYDPRHPKGKKYTDSELRQHRNKWYEKVKQTGAISVNPDYIELDRALFQQIRTLMPPDGKTIYYLRNHDFGASFEKELNSPLYEFCYYCNQVDFEFLDSDLEGLRLKLRDAIDEFLELLKFKTFPVDHRPDYCYIPKPNSNQGWDERNTIIRDINKRANDAHQAYTDFIRLGRRKLAV